MRIRIIDLETTGFAPPDHAPCEVGFADLVSTRTDLAGAPAGWIVDDYVASLCHPGRLIPPESSAIHHIVDADVTRAIPWLDVLWQYLPPGVSGADLFAAHNAAFERQWVTDELTGGKPWICTYKCALRLWPEAPAHSNQALRYWLGLDVLRHIADNAHRAGPDAMVTAHMLRRMLETPGVTFDQLVAWTAEPALLVKCHIGSWRGTRWADIDDASFLRWILARDFSEDVLHTARHHLERIHREDAEAEAAHG